MKKAISCWCVNKKGIFDPTCPDCVDLLWDWSQRAKSVITRLEGEVFELKKLLQERP